MRRLKVAILLGIGMTAVGFACGILYSVGGFFVDLFTIGLNWGTVLAFGALVGMPVIFGVVGFAGGAAIDLVIAAVSALTRRLG